jgi:nicotinamide riboside kinase
MIAKFRIGISGSHCSGKSTLVDALAARKEFEGYPLIKEVAARFPREKRQFLATQLDIMTAQIEEEMKYKFFISDRTVIDNIAYSLLNFEQSVAGKTELDTVMTRMKQFCSCLALESEYISRKPYDLMVFVDEMFPIEDNGNRCLNEEYQIWIYNFLKEEIYAAGNLYGIPVLYVEGSIEERIKMILAALERMMN